jgi:hypothetical protein
MTFKHKYSKYKKKYLQLIQIRQRCFASLNLEGGTGKHVSFCPNSNDKQSELQRTPTCGTEWKDTLKHWMKRILGKSLHRIIRGFIANESSVQKTKDSLLSLQASVYFYDDNENDEFYENPTFSKICIGYALISSAHLIIINKDIKSNQVPELLYFKLKKIIDDNKKKNKKDKLNEKDLEIELEKIIDDYIDTDFGATDININKVGFKNFPIVIVRPSNDKTNNEYIDEIYKKYKDGILIDNKIQQLPNRDCIQVELNDVKINNIPFKTFIYEDI